MKAVGSERKDGCWQSTETQPAWITYLHSAARKTLGEKLDGGTEERGERWLIMHHYKLRKAVWVTSLFLSEGKTTMMIIITFDFFVTSRDLAGILVNHLSLLPFSVVDGLSYQTGQQISKISNRKKLRTKTFPMEGSTSRDWEHEDSRAVSAILLAHSCGVLQNLQVSC